jgi:hypothetical protein
MSKIKCEIEGCNKKGEKNGGKWCAMHHARLFRNGTFKTQKEMGIKYNRKLCQLNDGDVDFIKNNWESMEDKEMAYFLKKPCYSVRYIRRKLFGKHYNSNGKTFLKDSYRAKMKDTCELCGWNKAPCDIHHKIHRAKGGPDTHDNLICICPNCHRMQHFKKNAQRIS